MPDPILANQPSITPPPTFPEVPDIPQAPQETEVLNIPPIIVGPSSPKRGKGKIIATILGILLLVGAVGAGVILVKQNQDIREKADSCPLPAYPPPQLLCEGCSYEPNYDDSTGCIVSYDTKTPAPPREPNPSARCPTLAPPAPGFCEGTGCGYEPNYDDSTGCIVGYECASCPPTPNPTHSCPKPNLPPGGLAGPCPGKGCKTITDIDSAGCVWGYSCDCPTEPPDCVPNSGGCVKNSDCCNKNCSTGYVCGGGPTSTPTPTGTPTPTPFIAACSTVKAYDTNWNLLTGIELSSLSAGDIVRFTVSGIPADQIDKARFTINSVPGPEVTTKKPGADEYYYEYTIPAGVYSFTVTAQIHHLTLGWF